MPRYSVDTHGIPWHKGLENQEDQMCAFQGAFVFPALIALIVLIAVSESQAQSAASSGER